MARPNLIIADPSEDFRKTLAFELDGHFDIRLCCDGYETQAEIDSAAPDLLVMDPTLSGIDGISLLQHAAKLAKPPVALVISRFFSDYMLDSLYQLGVAYVMSKPCDMYYFKARILDLAQHVSSPAAPVDARSQISGLLLQLSIRPKVAGYLYLTEGILRLVEQPEQSITKELYPAIAAAHQTTTDAVEHSMRTAIKGGWARMDTQVWLQFFPANADGVIPRPTNADFLSRLAANIPNSGGFKKK